MDTENLTWWQVILAILGFVAAEILVILRAMGRRFSVDDDDKSFSGLLEDD